MDGNARLISLLVSKFRNSSVVRWFQNRAHRRLGGSGQRWNAQDPSRLDPIRVLHWWRVCLDELRVLRPLTLAVVHLGDLPERVTLLDRVHRGLWCGLLNLEIAPIDLSDAHCIPE